MSSPPAGPSAAEGEPRYVQDVGASNQYALPPRAKRTRRSSPHGSRSRTTDAAGDRRRAALDKKHRKRLRNIVDAKQRIDKRAELFEGLSQFRLPSEHLEKGGHEAAQHTRGVRKGKLNILAGSKRAVGGDGGGQSTSWHSGEHIDTGSSDDDGDDGCASAHNAVEVEHVRADGRSTDAAMKEDRGDTNDHDIMIVDEPGTSQQHDTKPVGTRPCSTQKSPAAKQKGEVKKTVFIPVYRDREIQENRMKLPILAEEQAIVEAINDNQVVILCGETGSGKTTQVPQFLYEAGYACEANGKMIGVTEPRRVAATSMSRRVSEEMALPSDTISYQIRFEGNCTEKTRVKFMTDGVLLKEMQSDVILSKYSVVIIDEAHERSVYSDILLGLLSRVVPLRWSNKDPLRLVIMSATLRVDDFTDRRLFKSPPTVVNVQSRQHPVTVYFNRRTNHDYIAEAYKRVCDIHRKLPDGAILIFVTGRQEVHQLINKLRKAFPSLPPKVGPDSGSGGDVCETEVILEKTLKRGKKLRRTLKGAPEIHLSKKNNSRNRVDKRGCDVNGGLAQDDCDTEFAPEWEDVLESGIGDDLDACDEGFGDRDDDQVDDCMDAEAVPFEARSPLHCLPLYSLLPAELQSRVFQPPPAGCRLCVVATNVAETSLTIPHVKYVVDTGKAKRVLYDPVTGVRRFAIDWTSQSAAMQRAGRAGRVAPGHCYRLYSSAVFQHDFEQHCEPEIAKKPIDELVLQMKSMNIIKVDNFPFPTRPHTDNLKAAERRLVELGAIYPADANTAGGKAGHCTALGRAMCHFPLSPAYAKLLCLAGQNGELLPYAIRLVAALTVREPWAYSDGGAKKADKERAAANFVNGRKAWLRCEDGRRLADFGVLLQAMGTAIYSGCSPAVCDSLALRPAAVREAHRLESQLAAVAMPGRTRAQCAALPPPTGDQLAMLAQCITAALAHNIAIRCDIACDGESLESDANSYRAAGMKEPLLVHVASSLAKQRPHFVIYSEVVDNGDKKCMSTLCKVEPGWIPLYAAPQCEFGEVAPDCEPTYDAERDQIVALTTCTIRGCALPSTVRTCPLDMNYYRHFAAALLDGRVYAPLADYAGSLLAKPAVVFKQWAGSNERVRSLLDALVAADVHCKDALRKLWEDKDNMSNRMYLYKEISAWYPQSIHDRLLAHWPPID